MLRLTESPLTAFLPTANPVQPDALRSHGFTDPGSEGVLRDLLQVAATFCQASAVLALQDEAGLWYCHGVGLASAELAELECSLGREFGSEQEPVPLEGAGLVLVEGLWVPGAGGRPAGCLCVVAPAPMTLGSAQRSGLRLLAAQIAALVRVRQEQAERRAAGRACAGSTFVPGLVHELRNFIFGISASLDAFQARAVGHDPSRYVAVIRTSLDRLNAFIEELRAYGDPQGLAWAERDLEPLLQEAILHVLPQAQRCGATLSVQAKGRLPAIRADGDSLRNAFVRLLDLALQQERPGSRLVLQVACRPQGRQTVIFGHLDAPGLQGPQVDPARLFEPFYLRTSGLGRLALPVARRIFEAHGGNLTAGPGPRGGMRIGFMLPAI